jgi:hypothetical protein
VFTAAELQVAHANLSVMALLAALSDHRDCLCRKVGGRGHTERQKE